MYTVLFKSINSGVPERSVLSSTLFLLFIYDILNQTSCSIHCYADDTILHLSTSLQRRPILQEVNRLRRDATERLTSDLSKISAWGRKYLVVFSASYTQFLHLSTQHNLPDNYPFFFNDTYVTVPLFHTEYPRSVLYL
ncbi:hypothetical protein E2C01_099387 [Portunus trituberculatus]|uniref:Reverse transcriptase domain-containing protein n=1 Tax=Portunus trituberculatus TaxID=210409 RepID=A0A5B7KAV1_PORTR|nr:hypothetical protein [Portunus trituberculatus]